MGEHTPSHEPFVCAACGEDYGRETAVAECRICHRRFCDECLDQYGFCIPCAEEVA